VTGVKTCALRSGRVIRTGGFVQRRPVHAPGNG